jgi:FdhD protein
LDSPKQIKKCKAVRSENGDWKPEQLDLIAEDPFLIRVDDKPYSVVMRTPGDERYHAAGFCLGEGIIDSTDDFLSIDYDELVDPNVIDVRLKPERRRKIPGVLKRRSFVSHSSCGICGKELIEDLYQELTPAPAGPIIDADRVFEGIKKLSQKQQFYPATKGSHAALILSDRLETIAFAEDVGRHNALDKAIGKALIEKGLAGACLVILSSRNSHELVQKAARAHIPVMISHSRPTALAVEMAGDLNMTLGFLDQGNELLIVCGKSRIGRADI